MSVRGPDSVPFRVIDPPPPEVPDHFRHRTSGLTIRLDTGGVDVGPGAPPWKCWD